MKKIFSGIILMLLLISVLMSAFNIQPVDADGTVSGSVTETDGVTPIAGVSVKALQQGDLVVTNTTTATDGTYSLPLVSGLYKLWASADGYVTAIRPVVNVTTGTITADFNLTRGQMLVFDDFTGTSLDTSKWDSHLTGIGYMVVYNATSEPTNFSSLGLESGYASAGSAAMTSRHNASTSEGTVIFEGRISPYPQALGDRQPRGLRAGTDENNAIEFRSVSSSSIETRTVASGLATTTTCSGFNQINSWNWTYRIQANSSMAKFYVNDVLIATHTSNIPSCRLNIYMGTRYDGYGNVPVGADYLLLAIPPDIALSFAPAEQWNRTYGGIKHDGCTIMIQTGDGGYVMAGYIVQSPSNWDFWLVRIDSSGDEQWNRTYGGIEHDYAFSVVETSDGGYTFLGSTMSFGAGSWDFWLIKTDASGNHVWNKTYGGVGTDIGQSVIQTSDGGYTLSGYSDSFGAGSNDFWLVKTDSAGNMQWSRTYGGTGSDLHSATIKTSDGGYAISGYTNSSGAGGYDFWLVKTDSAGNMQWSKTYGGAEGDYGGRLVQTSDGGYAISGYTYSYGAGQIDFWLVKTDSNGNHMWNITYGGSDYDLGHSVVQTSDGGYTLAGRTRSYGAGDYDFWLVKTDSAGTVQWNQAYGGTGADGAGSVVQTSDEGYAIAGYTASYGAGGNDFWLIRTGPSPGADRPTAYEGEKVNFHVIARNEGTLAETFNVTAYYNNTAIETKTVTNLEPGEETTITFIWNTTGVTLGNYTLSAYAHPVFGEIETADNTFIDGTVKVTNPWGDWTHYHSYNEIINTLFYLNSTYPNIVDMFSIGKSWQNQDIYCIRLTNETNTYPKPKVFFVGYHHARELISAELPLYFAVEATTAFGTNATITYMLNYSEIYIVPALNPDGFDAVQANEWHRKNVHPYDEDSDSLLDEDPPDDADGDGYIEDLIFYNGTHYYFVRWEGLDDDSDGSLNEDWVGGVDLNRNYGYQWNATCESGSPDPFAEDYRGPTPFSEPETQAMRDLALSHNFKYAISFHSGADVILYPWGYTNMPTLHDSLFREVAGNLSNLVGSPYAQSGAGLYTSSGLWDDWMYANTSTFAFTCEIYTNDSAWQYEPGPEPDTWWERGVFEFFNPDLNQIEDVIQRWLPVFSYITQRAIIEAHDVSIDYLEPLKTVVGQGYSVDINVTVANQGDFSETFNVTIHANATAVGAQSISLNPSENATLTFTWNTTGFLKGNYVIRATADVVPSETDIADNTFVDGLLAVGRQGDVNGDGYVNAKDAILLGTAFYPAGIYNPNADVNNDGYCNAKDAIVIGANFDT